MHIYSCPDTKLFFLLLHIFHVPLIAIFSFTQAHIISSICPKTTQRFHTSHTHAPAPTVLAYRHTITLGVCSTNLNHIGWAHLWKQMSTGAGMLFLFRVESLRMAFLLFYSAPPYPTPPQSFSSPQQADLALTSRQEAPAATGGRKCSSSGFISPLFCLF